MYHEGALKNQILGIRKLGGLNMKVEGTNDHSSCLIQTAPSNAWLCADLEERIAEAGVFKSS